MTNGHLAGFWQGRIYQGPLKSLCLPGLNCYSCPGALGACPLGALQSAFSGLTGRIPFYAFGMLLLFGALLGRLICGFLCPFGLVQELFYKIPVRKVKKGRWSQRLTYLKYPLGLFFVLVLPLGLLFFGSGGEPTFCKYICPAGTFEASLPLLGANPYLRAAAGILTAWKFFLLFLLTVAALFVFRPFCRFFCPLGAWYGLFNGVSAFGIAVDKKTCTKCGRCAAVCQSDVRLAGDRECISCGECVKSCPTRAIAYKNPFASAPFPKKMIRAFCMKFNDF